VQELRDGTVKALLTDYPAPSAEIHLLYPARRLVPRRASLFMDAMAEAFAAEPLLNKGNLARLLSTTPARKASARSARSARK
jgi:hypothetical protein